MLFIVDNTRQKQLAWLQAIFDQTGWNASDLAREAGISHATISKFRRDGSTAVLETATVQKIVSVSPVPHYESQRPVLPDGFAEEEAEPFAARPHDAPITRAISAMRQGNETLDPWVLRSRALENVGYLPGDILMVDLSAAPTEGDVVCAQVSDLRGNAETAFRVFHKPYLVAATGQTRFLKPLLIDDRVQVMGVVVASLRPRLSRLAS